MRALVLWHHIDGEPHALKSRLAEAGWDVEDRLVVPEDDFYSDKRWKGYDLVIGWRLTKWAEGKVERSKVVPLTANVCGAYDSSVERLREMQEEARLEKMKRRINE